MREAPRFEQMGKNRLRRSLYYVRSIGLEVQAATVLPTVLERAATASDVVTSDGYEEMATGLWTELYIEYDYSYAMAGLLLLDSAVAMQLIRDGHPQAFVDAYVTVAHQKALEEARESIEFDLEFETRVDPLTGDREYDPDWVPPEPPCFYETIGAAPTDPYPTVRAKALDFLGRLGPDGMESRLMQAILTAFWTPESRDSYDHLFEQIGLELNFILLCQGSSVLRDVVARSIKEGVRLVADDVMILSEEARVELNALRSGEFARLHGWFERNVAWRL